MSNIIDTYMFKTREGTPYSILQAQGQAAGFTEYGYQWTDTWSGKTFKSSVWCEDRKGFQAFLRDWKLRQRGVQSVKGIPANSI